MLDEGKLTDNKGRPTFFRDAIIIMTSNIGANSVSSEMEKINKKNPDGPLQDQYDKMKNIIKGELRQYFRPEFLNRIDHVVVFSSLSRSIVRQIAERMYDNFVRLVKTSLKIDVKISTQFKDYILDKGYDPFNGARPLRRTIIELLEDTILAETLEGNVSEGQQVLMDLKDANATPKVVIAKPRNEDSSQAK